MVALSQICHPILKEIPESLLENHSSGKRQTIQPKAKPFAKRGFSQRTTSTKKSIVI
ncbi:hypothetical protein ACVQ90_11590 [Staphylococcus aureus]